MHVHRHAKVHFNDRGLYARVFEPRYEKTGFLHMRKTKTQISFVVTAKLISASVFATWILAIPLLPKYKISSL